MGGTLKTCLHRVREARDAAVGKKKKKRKKEKGKKGNGQDVNYRQCSQVLISAMLGISRVTLNEWARKGMPRKTKKEKHYYDPAKIFEWRINYQKELDDALRNSEYADEKERQMSLLYKERVKREARQNAEAAKRLLKTSDVQAALVALAGMFRSETEALCTQSGSVTAADVNNMVDRLEKGFQRIAPVDKDSPGLFDVKRKTKKKPKKKKPEKKKPKKKKRQK